MNRIGILFLLGLGAWHAQGQISNELKDDSWKKIYRAAPTKINDLVDTRLVVKFDFEKSYLYGKAWITLHPHFYPTDSLLLDAKGMDLHSVAVVRGQSQVPLRYTYDGMQLDIHLDRTYNAHENYVVYIDYTAKPNELKVQGSAAITDAKGLYFINPQGTDKEKPTEIWTQGETEGTSVWCPTIDKPNQKTTEQITMTVPAKYVTLSNGKLINQKINSDGTRTDLWKMDLPHAPYLFFMGVGPYAIVKDSYKGKEVNYYVEKEYEAVAKKIFGKTPEMIAFYSKLLGFDFPWVKYDQMTARDYVSGAMENTTATLHTDALQQDARQLVDGNVYEDYVAHELFHQWFGDLVTTESWSNLTLNESFANFSEVLWNEYKYGKDAGDAANYREILKYLDDESNPSKDLVRFYYSNREDMFDMVTYSKGGRILNMLRNYVGDSAFFKSLNLYLNTYKFKSAEAHQLRRAFEDVTGQDLNWFWNQWYFGSGHPILKISYKYNDAEKTVSVFVKQVQETEKTFILPVAIDLYENGIKQRKQVWVNNKMDSFTFAFHSRPDLVNFDGDKILLCEKQDDKMLENFIYQYRHAGLYLDRKEAIDFCAKQQTNGTALGLLKEALQDRYYDLRIYALNKINLSFPEVKAACEPILVQLAESDPKSLVRASALNLLGKMKDPKYRELFERHIKDSSYSVAGNALAGLNDLVPDVAYEEAKKMIQEPAKGDLMNTLIRIMAQHADAASFAKVNSYFKRLPLNQAKFDLIRPMCTYTAAITNTELVKSAVDNIVDFRNAIPEQYGVTPAINNLLQSIINRKSKASELASEKEKGDLQQQINYIQSKISGK